MLLGLALMQDPGADVSIPFEQPLYLAAGSPHKRQPRHWQVPAEHEGGAPVAIGGFDVDETLCAPAAAASSNPQPFRALV